MSAKFERTEGKNEGVLTITLSPEELDTALDQAFQKL